jgi:hypothetical protein
MYAGKHLKNPSQMMFGADFARILKDPAFFWKKESGPKKTNIVLGNV